MLTIYHNPRCSKSREALSLLEQADCKINIVEYLKTPPSAAELAELLKKLGISARDLLRTKEELYRELNLADPALTEAQLIAAMVENPRLIERPIVIKDDKAVIGRPAASKISGLL